MPDPRKSLLWCLLCGCLTAPASHAETALTLSADIAPRPMAEALAAFGRQTGLQLIYVSTIAEAQQSKGARAGLPVAEALAQLLEGTGLRFEFLNARTVRIYPAPAVVPTAIASSVAPLRPGERHPSPAALGLEEVLVTATRREEQASRVPISVVVWSQEAMEASGVKSMRQIGALTPGVEFDSFPDDPLVNTNISIRGVNGRNGTTVGVFLDDTPMPTPADWGGNFGRMFPLVFDLERVEVLRGPQGTLLGEGTEGGALRFITNQPSLSTFSGFTRAEWATTVRGAGTYEAGAAVGGPLVAHVLGFRVSGWYQSEGGYIDRVNPFTLATVEPHANYSLSKSARGAITIAPSDAVRITPSITYQTTGSNDSSSFYTYLSDPAAGQLKNGKLLRQPVDETFYLASNRLTAALRGAELQAVTSYFRSRARALVDATNVAAYGGWGNPMGPEYPVSYSNAIAVPLEERQAVFSQELRVASAERSPVAWLAGAFYARAHNSEPLGSQEAIGIEEWGPTHRFDAMKADQTQLAGYGQLDLRIADGLTVDAGLRVEHADHDSVFWGGYLNVQSWIGSVQIFRPNPPAFLHQKAAETTVAPKIGLSYRSDERNLWYATIARGYRMGGVNGVPPMIFGPVDCGALPKSYRPDAVSSYEIGAKNALLGGRVQLDTSVFHIIWSQLQLHMVIDPANEPCDYVSNAGRAVSNGFDFGAQALLTERLKAGLTLAYVNARYTRTVQVETQGGYEQVLVANGDALGALPVVPSPWNVTAAIDYRLPVSSGITAGAHAEDLFLSRNPGPFTSANPVSVYFSPDRHPDPSTQLLNLRAELSWPSLDVGVFVHNALDAQPTLSRRNRCCWDTLFYATTFPPRTLGVSAKWRF